MLVDAIACAERRAAAHDDARAVLCHGDLHELNALQADDGTFKLIDPEGVVAEPEYDLGVIMRNAPGEDDLHERADWLAAATGCDRTAIWEWGTAERVLSGCGAGSSTTSPTATCSSPTPNGSAPDDPRLRRRQETCASPA